MVEHRFQTVNYYRDLSFRLCSARVGQVYLRCANLPFNRSTVPSVLTSKPRTHESVVWRLVTCIFNTVSTYDYDMIFCSVHDRLASEWFIFLFALVLKMTLRKVINFNVFFFYVFPFDFPPRWRRTSRLCIDFVQAVVYKS